MKIINGARIAVGIILVWVGSIFASLSYWILRLAMAAGGPLIKEGIIEATEAYALAYVINKKEEI